MKRICLIWLSILRRVSRGNGIGGRVIVIWIWIWSNGCGYGVLNMMSVW